MVLKETLAFVGIWGAIGGGIGYAAEQHTNDISRARIVTVDTCNKIIPHDGVITEKLLDCMEDGVPNGAKIGPYLKKGQPIEYVQSFRTSQVNEANTSDAGNVILYALGGVATGYLLS